MAKSDSPFWKAIFNHLTTILLVLFVLIIAIAFAHYSNKQNKVSVEGENIHACQEPEAQNDSILDCTDQVLQ